MSHLLSVQVQSVSIAKAARQVHEIGGPHAALLSQVRPIRRLRVGVPRMDRLELLESKPVIDVSILRPETMKAFVR
jgi:hypothetical protein